MRVYSSKLSKRSYSPCNGLILCFHLLLICFPQFSNPQIQSPQITRTACNETLMNFATKTSETDLNCSKVFLLLLLFCFDILFVLIINVEVECCLSLTKMSLQFVASLTNKSRNWFNKKNFHLSFRKTNKSLLLLFKRQVYSWKCTLFYNLLQF